MVHLDRYERGIENILGCFDLRSSPKVSVSYDNLNGYSREWELNKSHPAKFVFTRMKYVGSEHGFVESKICEIEYDKKIELCISRVLSNGIILVDSSFLDFDKLRDIADRGEVLDPSLILLNSVALSRKVDYSSNTVVSNHPLRYKTARSMALKDILFEDIYKYDEKNFSECGEHFLQMLGKYFGKYCVKLGFD